MSTGIEVLDAQVQALAESAQQWAENVYESWIVVSAQDSAHWQNRIYGADCACCVKYDNTEDVCSGCPIADDSGIECKGTPWDSVRTCSFDMRFPADPQDKTAMRRASQNCHTACMEMYAYIAALLLRLIARGQQSIEEGNNA